MHISVIVAHPNSNSFNHAIAQAAVTQLRENGHRVVFHDLYAEKFDPILPSHEIPRDTPLPQDVEAHCREISSADGIILVHPNWWGQPPAILKGWIDRILRPGVAYEFLEGDGGEGIPVGLLKAEAALIFNTSNTPADRELEVFGDPLETLWKNCVFGLCGVTAVYRETFGVIVTSTAAQRQRWLTKVRRVIAGYFPEKTA
jgi:NAD(P)H dehydrogenase (quinone)